MIGIVAAFVYYFSSRLLVKLEIDDVVDATPVHFCCGVWGVLAAGLFTTKENYKNAYFSLYADGGDRAEVGCNRYSYHHLKVMYVMRSIVLEYSMVEVGLSWVQMLYSCLLLLPGWVVFPSFSLVASRIPLVCESKLKRNIWG